MKPDQLCSYGFSHRSKLEHAVCDLIRLRELAGEIVHLKHEDTQYLGEARYKYIPDWKVRDVKSGEEFWIEAKGYGDKRWPTTKKQWAAYGPGKLEIWGGDHRGPRLDKTIIPQDGASTALNTVPLRNVLCSKCGGAIE